jgi:leucyl aminopeptidase
MNSLQLTVAAAASRDTLQVRFHAKGSSLGSAVPPAEFDGGRNTVCLLRDGTRRQLHVGLGPREKIQANVLRQAAGTALKHAMKIAAEAVALDLHGQSGFVQAAVEGAVLAAYRFEEFRPKESRRKHRLRQLEIVVPREALSRARGDARTGLCLAEATNLTRQVGDLPPNVLNPAGLARQAQALARQLGIRCRIWDEPRLRREGFGGILAVGQGSANPPRFVVLDCPAPRRNAPTVAVVGKAITFDSGGISIKPADRMEEMKWDKMGGCAVLGIVQAVRRLNLPVRLVGLIASAENMPGASAYRPSDLVTTWDGKTIEVLNTDAEGRIVLADALGYARDVFKPDLIIDLATLTGACVVALGGRRAGLFTTDEALRARFHAIGEETGDRVWPLPVGEEYDEQIRSDVALVKNTGGREGGACTAASFLRHWAGDRPWVHLDIAGPAMGTKEVPYLEKGATGFGVRLVTEFLRQHAAQL